MKKQTNNTKDLMNLEVLRHKNKMEEIEAERKAKLEVENVKFEHIMSAHRIKRADKNRGFGRF